MITHSARTKAGRAFIERVLSYATKINRVEIDNVTDERKHVDAVSIDLVRKFIDIDGRAAEIFEVEPTRFVYFIGASVRHVTRFTIHTVAIPE